MTSATIIFIAISLGIAFGLYMVTKVSYDEVQKKKRKEEIHERH